LSCSKQRQEGLINEDEIEEEAPNKKNAARSNGYIAE
jgi:hypothetical protein